MDIFSFLISNWSWIIYWVVTGIALIGVILNIEHDQRCFWIWSFTNAAFALRTYLLGAYEMTFLFCIYWVLAIIGIYRWKTNPAHASLNEEIKRLQTENDHLRATLQRSVQTSIRGGMDNGKNTD